jgi:hypothetical protein
MNYALRSLSMAGGLAAVSVAAYVAVSLHYPNLIANAVGTAPADVAASDKAVAPWSLEAIEGRPGIERVIFSARAVERIGVKTAAVREEKRAVRSRMVAGDVLTAATAATLPQAVQDAMKAPAIVVQVALTSAEDLKTAAGTAVTVYASPLKSAGAGAAAKPITLPAMAKTADGAATVYLLVDGAVKDLKQSTHVWVDLATGQSEAMRKVVPYPSMLYDAEGQTWTYVNTKPMTYERTAITVESIEGDDVVLTEGPPVGTLVVTNGAVEIFGTEFKVGH